MEKIRDRVRKTGKDGSVVNIIAHLTDDRYGNSSRRFCLTTPMFDKPQGIDDDVQKFFRQMSVGEYNGRFENRWFNDTLRPMMTAHDLFRRKKLKDAIEYCDQIAAIDWRMACGEWIQRRTQQ